MLKVFGSLEDDSREYLAELTALRHYNAFPAGPTARVVRRLDHDAASHTIVLERIAGQRLDHGWPGARPDTEITALLARTMAQLWMTPLPAPGAAGWWDLAGYMSALERPASSGFDPREVERAAALARELRSEPEPPVVLHGDLHHENVIVEDDGTVVVLDPKGVIGHPGYDVAPLLGNPVGRLAERVDVVALLSSRIDVLAEQLRRDRSWVAAWGWVGAMLGEVWSAESGHTPSDHPTVSHAIKMATR